MRPKSMGDRKMRIQTQIDRIACSILHATMHREDHSDKTWRQCIDSTSSGSEDIKHIAWLMLLGDGMSAVAWAERYATEKQLGTFA